MRKRKFDYDLIVIGSGAGGSAAAVLGAKKGLKVAIIERELFGGEGPNFGEVPNRAVFNIARTLFEAKKFSKFGLRTAGLGVNFPTLLKWKEFAVQRTGANDNIDFFKKSGITTFRGEARFINPHEITINQQHISAKNFLVATGSSFKTPEVANIENVNFLTPNNIFNLARPPKSIFIVGGTSEAVEIAQILAIFGTKVYMSEVSARILPKEDEEVGITMENFMVDQLKIAALTNTRVLAVEEDRLSKKIIFRRGGKEKFVRVDEILVAEERQPNTDIGLENANIQYDDSGITINQYLQTSAPHIFAAGAVVSGGASTTESLIASRVAIHNIAKPRHKTPVEVELSPRITTSIPEVASVGLSEDDCRKRDLKIKTAIAPLNTIARSNVENFGTGFVKIICDHRGKIIGGSIVAPEASSLIGEISVAIKAGLYAQDLAALPHAFQSWGEAIRICANKIR